MDEKFEIIEKEDGTYLIKGTCEVDKKQHETFYCPNHVSDEMKLMAFEHVKELALKDGHYEVYLGEIKEAIGCGISGVSSVCGGRFGSYVSRRVDIERAPSYGGPCYSTGLQIHSNKNSDEAAQFSFSAPGFKTQKAKENAQRILTNLLIDVLQLK